MLLKLIDSAITLGQYQCYWCPGSLHYQVISNHDVNNVWYIVPCLPQRRISTTCPSGMHSNQSGTKPKVVVKILATNFGIILVFVIYITNVFNENYVWYRFNNVIKYYGSMITPTELWALKNSEGYQLWQLVEEINFQSRDKLIFLKYEPQWVCWSAPHHRM